MAKITLRPTSGSGNNWSNVGNAYDGNESTSASVSVSRLNYSSRYLTLNFNTSVIPSGATINSATLTIRSRAGKNTITAYVDINGDEGSRVINQKQSTSVANYTANVASYISNLSNIVVIAHNTNWSGNTFELYELWIDVDYTASTTYTVRFLDWNNSVISTQTVPRGGSATAPPNPTRDGYTFTGWDKSFTNITTNTDIHAQYTIKTYTVRFLDYDDTELKSETVNHGDSATPPANPSRVGYDFSGWEGTYTNITSDVDIKATYTIKTYTVRFLDWNDTVLDTQTINHGSNATPPPNPTRDGYTFTGWSGNYTNVTANVDVIAQYTQNSSSGEVGTSVKNIKIGSSTIDKLCLGTSQILKAYLGSILLYSYSTGGGSTSNNLFNKETAKLNTMMNYPEIGSEIVFAPQDGYFASDYIEVKPNTRYIVSYDGVPCEQCFVAFLNEDKKIIDASNINPSKTPSGTKYIVFFDKMDNLDTLRLEEYVSKNLFIKEIAVLNYKMDQPQIGGEVTPIPQDGYFCSSYTEAEPNTRYIVSHDGVSASEDFVVVFLDEQVTILGFSKESLFTTPAGTKYIIFHENMNYLDTTQLEEYVSKNLFNKATAKLNTLVDAEGIGYELKFTPYDGYFASDYIEVKPNTEYVLSYDGVKAEQAYTIYLDKNKKVLNAMPNNPFTTPSGTKYIVFYDEMNKVDTAQLEEGNTATDYEPY